MRRAVVGVVDVDGGVAAVEAARALGCAEVTLVAVEHGRDDTRERALLEDVRERAGHGGLDAVVVHDRAPGRALLETARERDAGLLVLGAPGTGGPHFLHGGEAGRVALHRAPCPVLVLRGGTGAPGAPRMIGAGFDGSPSARAAVAAADALAQDLGAALTVLTAWRVASGAYVATIPEELAATTERGAREQLDALLETLPPRTAARVVHGTPEEELRELSETVDLLVVGTGDCGPARRVLAGSTADALMHGAACPVLVVPSPAADGAGSTPIEQLEAS